MRSASFLVYKTSVFKMGQPQPHFDLFLSIQSHITNFTTNRCVKNVRPVYGATDASLGDKFKI